MRECRRQKAEGRKRGFLHWAFCILHFAAAAAAFGNDLTVDRRTIRMDESITIIVSLEDAFAAVDDVRVPVKNLTIDSGPSISSEFSWINGAVVRRKVFRFTARPIAPGAALVGPLIVAGEGGQRETLAPASVQVTPDEASASNEPLTILRELLATRREPFFVASEIDKTTAYIGEEIVVTWYLYNAASVQRWQITKIPKLPDFWTEEIDVRSEPPSQVIVGTMPMERVALRRVAIFPLRSGTLNIGGMEVSAAILRRVDDSPFGGIFEGSLVETRFPSANLKIDVQPLPPGVTADVVGEVSLDCGIPAQRAGGPVTMTATLRGRANLRTAAAPHFAAGIDGESEVQQVSLNVEKVRDGAVMNRRWSYIIFPAHNGTMTIPPLVVSAFNPVLSRREELRCAGSTLEVQQASAAIAPIAAATRPLVEGNRRALLPWIAGAIVAVLALLVLVKPIRRRRRVRRQIKWIMNSGNIRETVDAMVDPNALAREASDRGDAYRSLRSLLDAVERDRALDVDVTRELEARVRDLVQSLQ